MCGEGALQPYLSGHSGSRIIQKGASSEKGPHPAEAEVGAVAEKKVRVVRYRYGDLRVKTCPP